MKAFLIPLSWAVLWLVRLGWTVEDDQAESAPVAGIQAILILGGVVAVASEALSLVKGLLPWAVFLIWSLVFLLVAGIGLSNQSLRRGAGRVVHSLQTTHRSERLFWSLAGLIFAVLWIVAVKTPPNTTDSILYHLARVVHWAQNASLAHYFTGYQHQLYNPIWAEEVILHLRLLAGDDRLAGLVQWAAFIGVLFAVRQIALELGMERKSQLLTVAFAASLPIGLLQAASTQNDMVAAFFLCCTAFYTLRAARRILTLMELFSLGLAVGLGLLTKGTFYVFAAPLGLWFLISLGRWAGPALQRNARQPGQTIKGWRKVGQAVTIISVTAISLNLGYWVRNLITYGGPLGSRDWVASTTAGVYGLGPFSVALLRNIIMNFATFDYGTNMKWSQWLEAKLTPLDARMENFQLTWGWNHEDMAGNPLHVILIGLAIWVLLISWRRVKEKRLWAYLATVGGMYALLALFIHIERYGTRLQLPIFMIGAPIFGAPFDLQTWHPQKKWPARRVRWIDMVSRWWNPVKGPLVALLPFLLLMTAWPWVLISHIRPVIALKDGGEPFSIPCISKCTIGSILFESPETLAFANYSPLRQDYIRLAADIRQSGCQQIGLRIDSHHPEYLFWWILDAPQSGIRIESLYAYPELERYRDPDFRPCAVICTICTPRTSLHGLPLVGVYADALLFLGPGFQPELDP